MECQETTQLFLLERWWWVILSPVNLTVEMKFENDHKAGESRKVLIHLNLYRKSLTNATFLHDESLQETVNWRNVRKAIYEKFVANSILNGKIKHYHWDQA